MTMIPERARQMWMWRYKEDLQMCQTYKDERKSGELLFCVSRQAELTFCAGDIIAVFGDIDEDGFYYVSEAVSRVISTSTNRPKVELENK